MVMAMVMVIIVETKRKYIEGKPSLILSHLPAIFGF